MKAATAIFAAIVAATLALSPARANDGCTQFSWPVDAARKMLAEAGKLPVASGADREPLLEKAFLLKLAPWPGAPLAAPLQRAPKRPTSFAGYIRFGATGPGRYDIALGADAWVDVIQGGTTLKAAEFTGRRDCPGLRKVVRFVIEQGPIVIQLSDAETQDVAVVVTRMR